MAEEYIANMIEGGRIYINCEDKELGSMLYASLLAIQMEAAKYPSANKALGSHKSVDAFASAKIFPPSGVTLPDARFYQSINDVKEKFIKEHLGETQTKLGESMAFPALKAYAETSAKMDKLDSAKEKLSTATKALDDKNSANWLSSKFMSSKTSLQTAKGEAAVKAAKEKTELLTSEEDNVGKPRR